MILESSVTLSLGCKHTDNPDWKSEVVHTYSESVVLEASAKPWLGLTEESRTTDF